MSVFKTTLAAVFLSGLITTSALAGMGDQFNHTPGSAFEESRTYWIDSNQDVTVRFSLGADGSAHFHSRYSNGKKWDGDHFVAHIYLMDASGRLIAESIAGVGLNGSGMGGTNVAYRDVSFKLPPEYASRVSSIRFEAGHSQAVNDHEFWRTAITIAEEIFGDSSSGAVIYPLDADVPVPLSVLTFN